MEQEEQRDERDKKSMKDGERERERERERESYITNCTRFSNLRTNDLALLSLVISDP